MTAQVRRFSRRSVARRAWVLARGKRMGGKALVLARVGDQKETIARDSVGVYDLAGGIFAWHGAARPLVDAKGPTDFVHPYDARWGRLLARPELAREDPRG